jgi:hypothetical protein
MSFPGLDWPVPKPLWRCDECGQQVDWIHGDTMSAAEADESRIGDRLTLQPCGHKPSAAFLQRYRDAVEAHGFSWVSADQN